MISVVIPVFNGENYIERSVLSVINQTFKDVELIVVNDGSTDRTLEILEEIWKKYNPKGKVISIENSGSAHARNVGLDNISGDYFCLLDSDDYLETNVFESIFYQYTSFDVCYYGYLDRNENCELNRKYEDDFYYVDYITGTECAILKLKKKIWICHGSAVYNRKILEKNNIRYVDGINHSEDLYFITCMLVASNQVRCLKMNGVNIVSRNSSVMHSDYNSSFLGAIKSLDILKEKILTLSKENKNVELLNLIDIQKMEHICYVAKKVINSRNINFIKKYKTIKSFSVNGFNLLPCLKKEISTSKFIEYYTLRKSIVLYILMVKVFNYVQNSINKLTN